MELTREFIQLPLLFDEQRLFEEYSQFRDSDWIDHPQRHPGNAALILISVGGLINHDFGCAGRMRPTPLLARCPYIRQVLASLEAPLSRSRLMRLGPRSIVPIHDDVSYHWFRRVRVHIPIVTNRGVRFHCGRKSVHMRAGEAWIFDNFRPHRVENRSDQPRIHLVADTEGSPLFWKMLAESKERRLVPFEPRAVRVAIEPSAYDVISASDLDQLLRTCLPGKNGALAAAQLQTAKALIDELRDTWKHTLDTYGRTRRGVERCRLLMERFTPLLDMLSQHSRPGTPAHRAMIVLRSLFVLRNGTVSKSKTPVSRASKRRRESSSAQ